MDVKRLEKYIDKYLKKVTTDNAQQCINEFEEKWKTITDITLEHQSKYGLALAIFSTANYYLPNNSEKDILYLSELIYLYDTDENVKYQFDVKQSLYFNLGSCWHKLHYDNRAIEAFKKNIYYLITLSNITCYCPTAFAFKKCTTYLYQALINEQLNLSSPTTFNDPFDCPIKELLNNGDAISTLQLQAYTDCLKIACFTNNLKLPYCKNPSDGKTIFDEKKHKKDKEEYLNELMWAHYADSHRGICIKYSFYDSISQLGGENANVVAYFKDVTYSNKALSMYSKRDSINVKDAFFLKGKKWEYENELRFLYYDLNNQSKYGTIDIPNCIEEIYFGLKCSTQDKETIQNIMRTKEFVRKDSTGKIVSKSPIKFYQMELDRNHFGELKAVRI